MERRFVLLVLQVLHGYHRHLFLKSSLEFFFDNNAFWLTKLMRQAC